LERSLAAGPRRFVRKRTRGLRQIELTPAGKFRVVAALNADVLSVVSVLAGRIADTGVDPMPIMKTYRDILVGMPKAGTTRWIDGRNMKTLKSLVLAGISSLLLAAGFARAAEKFDPLSAKAAGVVSRAHLGIRAPCSIPCFEN